MDGVQLPPWAIRPVTGGRVDNGDVVGRDQLVVDLLAELRAGNNVLLVDPRRTGKTTVLQRLCMNPGADTDAVLIDLEGADTIGECFSRLVHALKRHDHLWKRLKRTVGEYVESVDVTRGPVTVKTVFADRTPIDLFADLVKAVDSRLGPDRRLIVAIDELPMAVDSIMRNGSPTDASKFLHRLRHLRQSTSSIRWILAGSIGFHHVLRRVGDTEGVIGDLASMSPGPLSPEWAEFLARCLLLGIEADINDENATAMASVTGGFPFVMHHVAHRLKDHDGTVTGDDVSDAFEQFARDRDASRALTHMLSRLDDPRLPPLLDRFAQSESISVPDLLKDHSVDDQPLTKEALMTMLDLLCDDHYLTHTTGGFAWKYDVLRRIWIVRRGLDQ